MNQIGPDLTCAEVVELASAYLDGELDAATADRVVAHVAGCPGCGPYIEQFRVTVELLASLREYGGGVGHA